MARQTSGELLRNALLEEMRQRGWNQAEVSKQCNLSQGTVSNIVNVVSAPSPVTIERLAQCFDWSEVTLNRLFYGDIEDEKKLIIEQIMHRLRLYDVEVLRRADRTLAAAFEAQPETHAENSG